MTHPLDTARLHLTLREYFAAQALIGLTANSISGSQHMPETVVKEAVNLADLLINELNKQEDEDES